MVLVIWDTDSLATCYLTDRCKKTSLVVRTEVNAFINLQLTAKRGGLLKGPRLERKKKGQFKYGVDQNGRVTVKVNKYCNFEVVMSKELMKAFS